MALDFFVTNSKGGLEKSILLYLEDYDELCSLIEKSGEVDLIKRIISNYYSDYEFYNNELPILKEEVFRIRILIKESDFIQLRIFVDDFLEMINWAINNHQTIKVEGD